MTRRNAAHNFTWSAIGFGVCFVPVLISSLVGWL